MYASTLFFFLTPPISKRALFPWEKWHLYKKRTFFSYFRECQFYPRRDKNFLQTRRLAAEIRHLGTRFAFLDKVCHSLFFIILQQKSFVFICLLGCSSKTQKCHFFHRKSAIRKSTVFDTNALLPSGRGPPGPFSSQNALLASGGALWAHFLHLAHVW